MAKITHAPDDRRLFNNASNKLKTALRDLRNASFTAYVSSLKRDDYSIWKPLKSRKSHEHPSPRSAKILHPQDPGPRATPKKSSSSLPISRRCLPLITTPGIQTSTKKTCNKYPTLGKPSSFHSQPTQTSNQTAQSTQDTPLRPHHSSYDTRNATRRTTNSPALIQRYS